MIHWLRNWENKGPQEIQDFLLQNGADLAGDPRTNQGEILEAHARVGDLWVWCDPYSDDIHGIRRVCWAETQEAAWQKRQDQADDI